VSTYAPIPESEKFRIEYWALEEAKLRRLPKPNRWPPGSRFVTGAGSGIGRAHGRTAGRRGCLRRRGGLERGRRHGDRAGRAGRRGPGNGRRPPNEAAIEAAFREAVLLRRARPDRQQRRALDFQEPARNDDGRLGHPARVMPRGSFLVSRAAAQVMIEQGIGGDIVYIASKNAVFAGPQQCRVRRGKGRTRRTRYDSLRPSSGATASASTASIRTAFVRGSGIFASGWGAKRAAVYGVPGGEARRVLRAAHLLKREVLPEHVAAAVFALTGGRAQPHNGSSGARRRRCRRGVSCGSGYADPLWKT